MGTEGGMKKEAEVLREFGRRLIGANVREAGAAMRAADQDIVKATGRLGKFEARLKDVTTREKNPIAPERVRGPQLEAARMRLKNQLHDANFQKSVAKARKDDAIMDTAGAWSVAAPASVATVLLGREGLAALRRSRSRS